MAERMNLNLFALRAALKDGSISAEQLIDEVFARIEAYEDPSVWIVRLAKEEVLAQLAGTSPDQPLYGIPFAIKDNIDAAGIPTTAACPAYAYVPEEDATVVARLKAAGALLIGKTNLDQFATGLVGVRSPHGAPRCVFDADYVSGGSSSGSGVAVGAGLVSFTLGTDTAGSGRVPASFNNIVGIKPTKGLVSAAGVVPACRSIDCVSIFAGSCAEGDAIRLIMEGQDERDAFSRVKTVPELPEQPVLGILKADQREFYGDTQAAALYQNMIDVALAQGWAVSEFDYDPFREAALLLYSGPWVAERTAAVGEFMAANAEACDPTVSQIVVNGPEFSAVEAFEGQYRLKALEARCKAEWKGLDALLLPTTPTQYTVDQLGEEPITYNSNLGHYTNFVNLLDYAAVAFPAGFRDGRPWGCSLIGPAFSDTRLAQWADQLHHAALGGEAKVGNTGQAAARFAETATSDFVELAVVGAHLTGMPLNPQLTEREAVLIETAQTAPGYRLYALKGTVPPKPGLQRDEGFAGEGIALEIWRISAEGFGSFTELVPPPLAIGNVELSDGRWVKGFVCEGYALDQAEDITSFGGWRAYQASL